MRLLLVDDEEYSREGILSLINAGEPAIDEIRTAENGRDGIAVARDFKPDIILADVKMPKIDGLTMCEEIRAFLPHCSIIIISGYSDKEYLKSAIRLSAVNYLEKPFHPQELMGFPAAGYQPVLFPCQRRNSPAAAAFRHRKPDCSCPSAQACF